MLVEMLRNECKGNRVLSNLFVDGEVEGIKRKENHSTFVKINMETWQSKKNQGKELIEKDT